MKVRYHGDFDTMFDWFCDGSVVHSNFFDFELAWWRESQKKPSQILWLTFEDIKMEPIKEISKVARFLGVTLTNEQCQEIAEHISFEKMKSEAEKSQSSMSKALMNKGKIGRWKSKLSEQQSARIDRIVQCRFANTGITFNFGDNY